MIEYIQILLLLWIIERISIERNRYKIAIDTSGQFLEKGYWSIWIYEKKINGSHWWRYKRLIHFWKFIIPKLG